jgi:hypothetical protein
MLQCTPSTIKKKSCKKNLISKLSYMFYLKILLLKSDVTIQVKESMSCIKACFKEVISVLHISLDSCV